MREDKIDIRGFNFGQLGKFIAIVAEHSPWDLPVFAKYVDNAISQGFYNEKELDDKFRAFVGLMHTFALHGEMTEGAAGIYFTLMISKELQKKNNVLKPSVHENLIDIVWTLIYKETTLGNQKEMNPLIPKLIESLYNYQRDTPLSRNELLELF